jgi:hypothetical protein
MHSFSSIYTYRYILRRLPKDILNSTYCQSNVLSSTNAKILTTIFGQILELSPISLPSQPSDNRLVTTGGTDRASHVYQIRYRQGKVKEKML